MRGGHQIWEAGRWTKTQRIAMTYGMLVIGLGESAMSLDELAQRKTFFFFYTLMQSVGIGDVLPHQRTAQWPEAIHKLTVISGCIVWRYELNPSGEEQLPWRPLLERSPLSLQPSPHRYTPSIPQHPVMESINSPSTVCSETGRSGVSRMCKLVPISWACSAVKYMLHK